MSENWNIDRKCNHFSTVISTLPIKVVLSKRSEAVGVCKQGDVWLMKVYFCNRYFSKRRRRDHLYLFHFFFEEPTLNF